MRILYLLLNYFFFTFHTALVVFNLFGWIFPKTRRLNLLTLLLTAFSWGVMGIWYGWGYCICTHWHWQVRRHLGYANDSPTYIHLLLRSLTGINFPVEFVVDLTAVGFFISLAASLWVNGRDFMNRQKAKKRYPV